MKKSTKILAAICAVAMAFGMVGCDKNTDYPDFINPSTSTGPVQSKEKYIINVLSEGGLKLNGVQVTVKNKSGETVRRSISVDGKIELDVSLGEYDLEIDEASLPAGYVLTDENRQGYKTNPDRRDEVNIRIPSSVIPSSSNKSGSFSLGGVMKDFTFTDNMTNAKYTLSEVLKTKKAVVLNFWYSLCGPCKAEFGALNQAYSTRDDIEVFAICTTTQGDTAASVADFKKANNLSLPMGIDNLGFCTAFSVPAYPTTIVVDRYGVIAYRHTNSEPNVSFWSGLFNRFTSSEYVQEISGTGSGSTGGTDREKPTFKQPASADLADALLADGVQATFRADPDEYSWPWIISDDGEYVYSSNKDVNSSYAILYADISMEAGQLLSFDYKVSSESNDLMHVMLDGDIYNGDGWSATGNEWQTAQIYVADVKKTVELAFVYRKNAYDGDNKGEDRAMIRNISLSSASSLTEPLDVFRTCASGKVTNFKYEKYVDVIKDKSKTGDDYYHVLNEDNTPGSLLYVSLSELTAWSDAHIGATSNAPDGNPYYNTLYYMTYYRYGDTSNGFNVNIGGTDLTQTVLSYWNIQGYMEAPYHLLPVSEELKEWIQAFVTQFEMDSGFAQNIHDDEWLEFCFYYDHYGPEHNNCKRTTDPSTGLTVYNSYTAYEKDDLANLDPDNAEDAKIINSNTYNKDTGRNVARITYPLQGTQNGVYYKFTSKEKGVYQVRSFTTGCSAGLSSAGVEAQVQPDLAVYDAEGNYVTSANGGSDLSGTKFEGFNHYMELDAGETVFLYVETAPAYSGYYDFEIEYLGTDIERMLTCSTGGGSWTYYEDTGVFYYLAIDVAYNMDDGYYYKADREGNPILSQPVYIDFIHSSYLMSDLTQYNFCTLEQLIGTRVFTNIRGEGYTMQKELETYLGLAKAEHTDGVPYGFVKADRRLAEIFNTYIDNYVDGGRGEGNGWLMFATYIEFFGK